MHLRYGTPLMRLAVAGGVLWLAILLLGTMDDFMTRAWLGVPGK
jgi:caa(3)-type oxidase subunit IV